MSVGVWDPNSKPEPQPIDSELLHRFVQLASSVEDTVDAEMLEALGLSGENRVMTAGGDAWEAADALDTASIISLIRLFTLLEEQVSGWDAGNKSPVIPLVKLIKARGEFDAELRKWIKRNSKNRYLPYGSAL